MTTGAAMAFRSTATNDAIFFPFLAFHAPLEQTGRAARLMCLRYGMATVRRKRKRAGGAARTVREVAPGLTLQLHPMRNVRS